MDLCTCCRRIEQKVSGIQIKTTGFSTSKENLYMLCQKSNQMHTHTHTHIHTYKHTQMFIDVCMLTQWVCVCICVCAYIYVFVYNYTSDLAEFHLRMHVTGLSLLLNIILSFSYVSFSPMLQGSDPPFTVWIWSFLLF